MYLILSNSEYWFRKLIKWESLYSLEFSTYEYALTFWPSKVISFTPFSINCSASDIILFRIYNRFGQEVYNGDELPNGGWDGTLGGISQPTEVYIYVLTFKRQSDTSETTLRGQVNLIR